MKSNTETALAPGPAESPAEYKKIDSIRTAVALTQNKRYEALAIFTDGLPWNKKRYIESAKESLQQHVLSGIEAGKRLLVLREMLPHGEFVPALEEIGIGERSANNYMRVAFHFTGLDAETKNILGITKLYKMLSAPAEDIQRFQTDGEFLSLSKDELIQMSTKELGEHVKNALGKTKLDLDQERMKSDVLFKEKQELAKDKARLESELLAAKTGKPPENPLPVWWNEYEAAVGAVMALSTKLAGSAPDLSNTGILQRCEQSWQRLSAESDHVRKYLQQLPVDPVASATAVRHKVAALNNDSRFNFDALNEND